MQKTLIKHSSPDHLSLSRNPEYYWTKLKKLIGPATVWSLISLARVLHSPETRNSFGSWLLCAINLLIPAIVVAFYYWRYLKAKQGQVIEFNGRDKTIFITGGDFFHFEEVMQLQVKEYHIYQKESSFAIYLQLWNGLRLKIESFDTYWETKSVLKTLSGILDLPITSF